MEISEKKEQGAMILELNGRLDAVTAPGFGEKVLQVIEGGENKLVLALEGLEYVSSAGLREFLKAAKKMKSVGGKIALCSMKDYVREIFDMSGFASLIPIKDSVDQAVEEVTA